MNFGNLFGKKKIDELEKKLNYLEEQNSLLNSKNSNLNSENAKLKYEISNLKSKNAELKSENSNLKLENTELKSENINLKSDNTELNSKNSNLKSDNTELNSKNNNLKKENEELNSKNSNLISENTNLKSESAELNTKIRDLNNILEFAEYNDPKIKKKIDKIEKFVKNQKNLNFQDNNIRMNDEGQIIGNENITKIDSINFYDVIVCINSIKGIKKGWEIKMNQRALDNYEKFKKDKIIKIGVIGNSNKGKSFLLSKISKINLPSGTSIRTEGLSIKYPQLDICENKKIALLDSAGLETPVIKEEEIENKIKEEEKDTKEEKNEEKEENEINEANEDKKKKNINKRELFKEKSREKIITELFLQNYIINNSDILIVVVGNFTFSEQKLLNRIKTEMKRAKIHKTLYIIHNLKTFTTVEQVENYIKEILLKSATFDLEEQEKITTEIKVKNGINFYEKNSNPPVFHLIYANEGSEAGNYFNEFTLDYIEHTYQNVTDLKPFDVIKTIKERFEEVSKEIIERPEKEICFDESDNKTIKLIKPENIVLKRCLIDELGFSNLKSNGFEPNYNYYKKDDKLIVRIETPGNCTISTDISYVGEYTVIRIYGKKLKDKEPKEIEQNIFNSREMGDYSIDILLKTEDYSLKNKQAEIKRKNGLFILYYSLEEKLNIKNEYMTSTEEEV